MILIRRLLLALLALAPMTTLASPTAPVAGEDYEEIADGRPYRPQAGKIEVAEVFGYTCPHCAHFAPQFEQWAARQPKDVRVTLVPAAFGGPWDGFARAYLAAEALGVAGKSHEAMFRAIHDTHSMPSQNVSADEFATFYAGYGVTPQRFVETLKSDKTQAALLEARQFAQRSGLTGTPSLVVNGRYLVNARSFEDMLRIADALVARERTAGR